MARSEYITGRSREWPIGFGASGRLSVEPLTFKRLVGGSRRGKRVILMQPSYWRRVTTVSPRKPGAFSSTPSAFSGSRVASFARSLGRINKMLSRHLQISNITELKLSVRSANWLRCNEVVTIGDLVQKSEADLQQLPSFERKCLNETRKCWLNR